MALGCYRRRYRAPLLFGAAYLWSCAAFHYHLDHRLIESWDNRVFLLRGTISEIPRVGPGRLRLTVNKIDIEAYPATMPRRVSLAWYQDEIVPQPRERWQFLVKLRQPRGYLNPGGFDFEAWQFVRGVDAGGYLRASSMNRRLLDASRWSIAYWRYRLASAIDGHCGGCAQRGLIKALALGFRGDIEDGQKHLLQASGTAHLLAISGLHIDLVSFALFALGGQVWRFGLWRTGINRNHAASLFSIFGALLYAALAGFSLPTIRALIMLLVLLFALMLKSRVNLLQSLSLAIIVIVLVDPRAVGSSSFWLSVCALLLIAFVQFRLPVTMRRWQQLLFLQAGFSLLFAPLGVLIFEQLTPSGFAANLIAIPLVSFVILPIVLLGCLLLLAGLPGAGFLLALADRLLQFLLEYFVLLAQAGLDSVGLFIPVTLLILAAASTAWLLLPGPPFLRMAAAAGLAMILPWQAPRLPQGAFELLVLDVGMGTSVLLRTRFHSLVYDFGPGRPGGYSAADGILAPAMRRAGIERPDLAIVSHVDQDHSGGLYSYLARHGRPRLLSGTPRELQSRFGLGEPVRSCHDYPAWRWDGVDFRFLAASDAVDNTNNRSCVLLVEGHHRALLPGDIETARESALATAQGASLAADILVAPHHGSGTSSSADFVRRVAPGYVVYTLSRANRWGFPSDAVEDRYDAVGARQYRSDRDGAVGFTSSEINLSIRPSRHPARRIWRRW